MTKGFLIFFCFMHEKKEFYIYFLTAKSKKMQRRCMGEHYKHTCLGDNR